MHVCVLRLSVPVPVPVPVSVPVPVCVCVRMRVYVFVLVRMFALGIYGVCARMFVRARQVAMSIFHDTEDGQTIKAYETG
jgi:hypothetical protein